MSNSWDDNYDLDKLARNYQRINHELLENPTEIGIEEVTTEEVKYVNMPRLFTPPLQYQRNAFVRDILRTHTTESGKLSNKMAVLGCGSLSLERFLLHILANLGFDRIISVDIDKQELAKGIKLMKVTQQNNENIICGSTEDPVLIEIYHGDILNYDGRLSDVNCVCSTEVIEHIPIDDATKYMKLVLGKIRPELFIISTPNREYNEAFGIGHGVFRHDDHKFEFSRDEFKTWLSEIIADYKDYNHTVEYVGNLKGFTHLGGATQFAIFKKKPVDSQETNVEHKLERIRCFKKVGYSVVPFGIYAILRNQTITAFTTWLNENPLKEEDCVESLTRFWRIPIKDIVRLIQLPEFLISYMTHSNVMSVLEFACRFEIYSEEWNGNLCVNIPSEVSKEDLIKYMNNS